jgi:hypothetical protein
MVPIWSNEKIENNLDGGKDRKELCFRVAETSIVIIAHAM